VTGLKMPSVPGILESDDEEQPEEQASKSKPPSPSSLREVASGASSAALSSVPEPVDTSSGGKSPKFNSDKHRTVASGNVAALLQESDDHMSKGDTFIAEQLASLQHLLLQNNRHVMTLVSNALNASETMVPSPQPADPRKLVPRETPPVLAGVYQRKKQSFEPADVGFQASKELAEIESPNGALPGSIPNAVCLAVDVPLQNGNMHQTASIAELGPSWSMPMKDLTEDDELPEAEDEYTPSFSLSQRASVAARREKCVFADKGEMVEKVMEALMEKEYNVCDFYWTEGIFQSIARSAKFDNITLSIIAMNALWIAIDSDMNDAAVINDAHWVFKLAENLFCIYFTFEWFVRYMSFKRKMNCLRDRWFLFDSTLVLLLVFETWLMAVIFMVIGAGDGDSGGGDASVLKLLRLLRLSRTARMTRLLQHMPELMIMIKGLAAGFRSVLTTLFLLFLLLYVFGIGFRQAADDTAIGEKYFRSVPDAMLSLLVYTIFPDMAMILMDLLDHHIMFGLLGLIFILVATLMVLNLLVGVLVEAVSVVAHVEKEQSAAIYIKKVLTQFLDDEADSESEDLMSKPITQQMFQSMASQKEFGKVMQQVGVDVAGLVSLTERLFKFGDTVPFPDFFKLIMQLRGANHTKVKDIVDLRMFFSECIESVEAKIVEQQETLMRLTGGGGGDDRHRGAKAPRHSISSSLTGGTTGSQWVGKRSGGSARAALNLPQLHDTHEGVSSRISDVVED